MQKRNTKSEKQLAPNRQNSSFQRVKQLIDKLWGRGCWMTDYACQRGHFSVITTGNGEPKKFLVGLDFLSYPSFVRLLEAAEREFGFEQQGVLAIPCKASELQQILSQI